MNRKQDVILPEHISHEEAAAHYIFPVKPGKKALAEADDELKSALASRREKYTPEFKRKANLLQLKIQIANHINDSTQKAAKTFGTFLKQYMECVNKRNSELASEIDIPPSELSQYINNHRKPPKHIMIRLELHSQNAIPAIDWYRLAERDVLYDLSTNKLLRKEQIGHVKLNYAV